MSPEINFSSLRARKARTWQTIGRTGYNILRAVALILILASLYCLTTVKLQRVGYLSLGGGLLCSMVALWWRYDLSINPPSKTPQSLDDILAPNLLAKLHKGIDPRSLWDIAIRDPSGRFMCNRLFLNAKAIGESLPNDQQVMPTIWKQTQLVAQLIGSKELYAGTVIAALLSASPTAAAEITEDHLRTSDIAEVYRWLDRQLSYFSRPHPYFGGIGRDWSAGFTPMLERFGQNISHAIEVWGGYGRFATHADLLSGIVNNLGHNTAVALVGPEGVGKSELVFALADRLLSGQAPDLKYYQIISLDASAILASGNNGQGGSNMEQLMNILFSEAVAAHNIILYLDEAQLFFSRTQSVGAFDMSQLLMPLLKGRHLKIIASFTPNDWQHIRATNPSLAAGFAPVVLTEPTPEDTLKVVEDSAVLLELQQRNILITYEAVLEAIRLSGQFMQEDAYPGKAIGLLEQSMPYADNGVLTNMTIQTAIEKLRGVRVSTAQAAEASMLLELEDRIHQRMIDQTQAVKAVASALRRSRAGVSNPKRPVGTFLFLGPTGVGKTELARSLAAVYFGDEHQMIRLDMSEYQNPEDVRRLLEGSQDGKANLLTAIRQQPFSVLLLDEIEKAHSNVLNLLLQLLDEGQLTDDQNRPASFRNAIIILTSNAGATSIIGQVRANGPLDDNFERTLLDQLITAGVFKPELINRFDEVVLFRPLGQNELMQVAQLMLGEVNHTLATQNISVALTPAALAAITEAGYDPEFGARPMRRVIQKTVENAVATRILSQEAHAGTAITLDVQDLSLPNREPEVVLNGPTPSQ